MAWWWPRNERHIEHLWDEGDSRGENPDAYGDGAGLTVRTDRQAVFVQDGVMSKKSEDFTINKVSSV